MIMKHIELCLFAVLALLVGYTAGLVQGRTNPSPYVLSITAIDKQWVDNLYNESRSIGDCVVIDPINRDGAKWYWLHSC